MARLVRDGKWLPLTLGLIPLLTYIATWSGWLITRTGYYRDYAQNHGVKIPVISALYSLFQYHHEMVDFGVGLSSYHPYKSQPWGWIVLSRPVAFYYECYTSASGAQACPKDYSGSQWSQEVLAIGNPAIWWVSIAAMLFCLGWWLTRRDWRAGAVLLCIAAGWLTWLPFMSRTKFDYYSLEFLPFLILAITLCLGLIIGPAQAEPAPSRPWCRGRGDIRPCGADPVLVFLSDPRGPDHPVLVVASPHVVPRLDLTGTCTDPRPVLLRIQRCRRVRISRYIARVI